MSFFKKIGKSVSSAFKKAPGVVSDIFKKGEAVAGKVAGGLSKVGDVLGKVADVGGQILSNPLVGMAGSALLGPEFGAASQLAGQGLQTVRQASNVAKAGSGLVSQAGRASGQLGRGDIQGGIATGRDTIERAKAMRDAGIAGPQFA